MKKICLAIALLLLAMTLLCACGPILPPKLASMFEMETLSLQSATKDDFYDYSYRPNINGEYTCLYSYYNEDSNDNNSFTLKRGSKILFQKSFESSWISGALWINDGVCFISRNNDTRSATLTVVDFDGNQLDEVTFQSESIFPEKCVTIGDSLFIAMSGYANPYGTFYQIYRYEKGQVSLEDTLPDCAQLMFLGETDGQLGCRYYCWHYGWEKFTYYQSVNNVHNVLFEIEIPNDYEYNVDNLNPIEWDGDYFIPFSVINDSSWSLFHKIVVIRYCTHDNKVHAMYRKTELWHSSYHNDGYLHFQGDPSTKYYTVDLTKLHNK